MKVQKWLAADVEDTGLLLDHANPLPHHGEHVGNVGEQLRRAAGYQTIPPSS